MIFSVSQRLFVFICCKGSDKITYHGGNITFYRVIIVLLREKIVFPTIINEF